MENNQKDNHPKKINWKLEAHRYSFEPRYKLPKSFLDKIDSDSIFEKEK